MEKNWVSEFDVQKIIHILTWKGWDPTAVSLKQTYAKKFGALELGPQR